MIDDRVKLTSHALMTIAKGQKLIGKGIVIQVMDIVPDTYGRRAYVSLSVKVIGPKGKTLSEIGPNYLDKGNSLTVLKLNELFKVSVT